MSADKLYYPRQWASQYPPIVNPVPCPSCQGTAIFEGKRCFACLSQGVVESDRTCNVCGKWRSFCTCHHNEIEAPAQSTALPKRGRRAFGHATMRRGHAQSARGKGTR